VHAHPDDETTKAGGTAAMLAANGVRTVLVTCTDGSAGDVTDVDLLQGRSLAEVRSDELSAAASILGFDVVHELGHPDSGMKAEVPGGFATMAMDVLIDELVELLEAERPDVVMTYDPVYAKAHPDHLRCHDVSRAAFMKMAASPGAPRKLYGSRFSSQARVQAMHGWAVANEVKSPFERALGKLPEQNITTRLDIGEHAVTALQALREHRTQVAHDNRWYYTIPDDQLAAVYPWEELELLATAPTVAPSTDIESSLFTGLS